MNLLVNNKPLIKEWNYDKNINIDVGNLKNGSNRKVWWKCSKGHEWETTIASRAINNAGCPYCTGRKAIAGYNDLETINPVLVKEWNYEKNNNLNPKEITANSHKRVWWKCEKCGFEWEAQIKSRNSGVGCPKCGRKKLSQSQIQNSVIKSGSLQEKNKKLATEWNYKKNKEITPDMVSPGSNKKVWWKCSKGHEWQAVISSRNNGIGCPYCSNRLVLSGYNDLLTINPNLSKDWDYKKNKTISPNNISPNSHEHVWWKCNICGHEWNAEIKSRNSGVGCPICAKEKMIKKRISNQIEKQGSLKSNNPVLASEWNYEKNGNLTPSMITSGSNKKVWWRCSKGHEWQAVISSRAKNNVGCPICASETQTSFAEQTIYFYLKKKFKTVYNRYVFKNQEIDLFIPEYNIGIEYDGARFHNKKDSIKREQIKYNILKENGIILIRIREYYDEKYNINSADYYLGYSNNLKNKNLNKIIKDLLSLLSTLIGNKDISIDVDIDRDRSYIYELYILSEKEKSLLTIKPKVAKYWNYEKNGNLTPDKVPAGSDKKVWWKCSKGHEWQAIISSRTSKSDCPYCLNQKVLKGYNDLATTHPKILKEWNYEKNTIKPDSISAGSNKKVWWICSKCQNEWQAIITSRVRGNGCPNCKNEKISKMLLKSGLKKYGSLYDNYPELLKEWNYDKNKNIDPKSITSSAKYKVWWKCYTCGYEWQAWIGDRSQGKGCPECGKEKMIKKRISNQIEKQGSLKSNNSVLASEWNYEKNMELKPENVTLNSNKKVWWKCNKCNYEWQAIISSRNGGAGCPKCSNHLKRKVFQYDKQNNFITQYNSISEASKVTGIHTTSISNVCKGDAKTAGGYIWKYYSN